VRKLWLAVLMCVLAFGAIGFAAVPNPDTLIYATFAGWDSWDPAYAYDSASGEALYNTCETLIGYVGGSVGEFTPLLATEVPSIANGLVKLDGAGGATVRFNIRQGVTFHNGDPLTAEDVVYSLRRLMISDITAGPGWILSSWILGSDTLAGLIDSVGQDAAYQKVIESVYVPADNAKAIEIKAKYWYPYSLNTLCDNSWAMIYSKKFAIEHGGWPGTKDNWITFHDQNKENMALYTVECGTGQFKLEGAPDPVTGYTLVRYEAYWNQATAAKVKRLEVRYVEEWTTRKLMLVNGDADMADIPIQYKSQVEGTPGLRTIYGLPGGSNGGYNMNLNIRADSSFIGSGKLDGAGITPDFFTDVHVRRAFSYLFPYEKFINQVQMGEAVQATGVIPHFMPFFNPDQEGFTYDPEKAMAEFKLAWGGQVFQKGFRMSLTYNAGNVGRQTACEMLRDELQKLDARFLVEARGLPWANYLDDKTAHKLPFYYMGWIWDYPDEDNWVTPYYSSTGAFGGPATFSALGALSTQLDSLIAQGRATTVAAERQAIYYDLQKLGHDNALGIIISEPTIRRWQRTWVGGLQHNPGWSNYNFKTIYKADGATPDLAELSVFTAMKVQQW